MNKQTEGLFREMQHSGISKDSFVAVKAKRSTGFRWWHNGRQITRVYPNAEMSDTARAERLRGTLAARLNEKNPALDVVMWQAIESWLPPPR